MELEIVDGIIEEPFGGAQRDYDAAAEKLGEAIGKQLKALEKLSEEELLEQRYNKFRSIGRYVEGEEGKDGTEA
jgi:acetyl-CoA carboxylase carboxyl transferase subunit alpha